jgi:hypothetical protein
VSSFMDSFSTVHPGHVLASSSATFWATNLVWASQALFAGFAGCPESRAACVWAALR